MHLIECDSELKDFIIPIDVKQRQFDSSSNDFTKQFYAIEVSTAIAFLSLDIFPKIKPWPNYLSFYELYVGLNFRGKNKGTEILSLVEAYAKNEGYERIVINPYPFDKTISKTQLINWYKKNGYSQIDPCNPSYEKNI